MMWDKYYNHDKFYFYIWVLNLYFEGHIYCYYILLVIKCVFYLLKKLQNLLQNINYIDYYF